MGETDFDKAMRYVVRAEFYDAEQGQNAYYYVKLNCGHTIRCSSSALRAAMLCTECFKESVNDPAGQHRGAGVIWSE